jgi:hypothetical protein
MIDFSGYGSSEASEKRLPRGNATGNKAVEIQRKDRYSSVQPQELFCL